MSAKKSNTKKKECTTYVRSGVTQCRKLPKGTKKSTKDSQTPTLSPPSTQTYNKDKFCYYMNKPSKKLKKKH